MEAEEKTEPKKCNNEEGERGGFLTFYCNGNLIFYLLRV